LNESDRIGGIFDRIVPAAIEYSKLTGKPLGITGEIGEWQASRILGLTLRDARTAGYDATDQNGRRIQIKTRCIAAKRGHARQQVGSIRLNHEWDCVFLVILNTEYAPVIIYEADRSAIEAALLKPGSKARNERGALSIQKFRSIGRQVWKASPGHSK